MGVLTMGTLRNNWSFPCWLYDWTLFGFQTIWICNNRKIILTIRWYDNLWNFRPDYLRRFFLIFFVGGIPDLVVFHNSYSGNIIYERHRNEILAILLYCFVGYYFDVWLKVRLLFILEVVTICCSLKNQCCTK